MKSKVWVLKLFARPDDNGYIQLSALNFYDGTSTLISTSSARIWCPDYYKTSSGGNYGTQSPFSGNLARWIAFQDSQYGNLIVITFPTEVDIVTFSLTTRSGQYARGTIELYKVFTTDPVYDPFASKDDMVLVNTYRVYSGFTQTTYTYGVSDANDIPTRVAKPLMRLMTADHVSGDKTTSSNTIGLVQPSIYKPGYYGDGTISGTVTNAASAAIVGAKIRLVDSAKKNFIGETVTDVIGGYSFTNLVRDGTLFDVLADEGTGTFEKKISGRRLPINSVAHNLVGDARKGSLCVSSLYSGRLDCTATRRKGTGGIAILNQTDPFYDKTVFLMNVNASTAVDQSSSAMPFTIGTLTIASTNSPPIGTYSIAMGSSKTGYFTGLANWYDQDFTIEYYVYIPTASASLSALIDIGLFSGSSYGAIELYWDNSATKNLFVMGSTDFDITPFDGSANTLSYDTWYHVAWVRKGDTYTLYRGGVQISSQTFRTYPIDQQTTNKLITFNRTNASTLAQLAGIRITTAARYTTAFTPPTASDLYG